MKIVAGIAAFLIGLWAFPYVKSGMIDPLTDVALALFPTMNPYLLLFLTWLPMIVLGLLAFAVISFVFNLAGGKR
jgi:hypothetical protein